MITPTGKTRQAAEPTGIPDWLAQFLNSQGGMQGLLYQFGGIQGLLNMIQKQSQLQQAQARQPNRNPNNVKFGDDPTGMSASDRALADPFGWWDYMQKQEAARPLKHNQGSIVTGWDTPPLITNRGNSAEASNPYGVYQHGSRAGQQIPYSPLYQGDQNVVIPTMAELQAKYPWMNNPLVAQGLNPLVPYFNAGGTQSPRPVNPYFDIRGQQAGDLAVGGIPDAEYQAWIAAGGFQGARGVDAIQYLPQSLKPTGTPEEIQQLTSLKNQYEIALKQTPNDPFLMQQAHLASEALDYAQYGPLGKMLGNKNYTDAVKPLSAWDRPQKPLTKYEHATQYGYGTNGRMTTSDWQNSLQTLQAGGWDRSMGYGPQTFYYPDGTPRPAAQQQELNDLLYAHAPSSPHYKTPGGYNIVNMGARGEWSADPEWQKEHYGGGEGKTPPDPFEGLQAAINRDAYVNETLGGGFYGGVIPDENAINTWGERTIGGSHDPHFPTPQLALGATPDQNKYDTYAGWAADQGAAFGSAPWAVDSPWGHAMGYDDADDYQQPNAPPTAWQPTPQFGQSTWSGTQGWGNNSKQQNNTGFGGVSTQQQQQPMSFGVSPWNNPWGMK